MSHNSEIEGKITVPQKAEDREQFKELLKATFERLLHVYPNSEIVTSVTGDPGESWGVDIAIKGQGIERGIGIEYEGREKLTFRSNHPRSVIDSFSNTFSSIFESLLVAKVLGEFCYEVTAPEIRGTDVVLQGAIA